MEEIGINTTYLTLKEEQKFLCLDIETTSLLPENEGIVELYYMVMDNGVKVDEGHSLFYHENIHQTQHLHQITPEDVANKLPFLPMNEDQSSVEYKVLQYLKECMSGEMTLMAQYAGFEINWMEHNYQMDLEGISVYCTRKAENLLNPGLSGSLIPNCERRGIQSPNGEDFHRAQWDVEAMWKVFLQQKEEFKERGVDLSQVEVDITARNHRN